MKNKILIIIALLFGFYHVHAQDTITIISGGDTTYKIINKKELDTSNRLLTKLQDGRLIGEVIVNFKGKSASQIYNSAMQWVAYTFRNTKAVVQSKIENKMIRISGNSYLYSFMLSSFDVSYVIQLDIKDEKMRFRADDLKQVGEQSPYDVVPLEVLYRKNGKPKTLPAYIKLKRKLDTKLTELLNSLVSDINGENSKSDDDW